MLELGLRLIDLSGLDERNRQVEPRFPEVGLQRDRTPKTLDGLRQLAGLRQLVAKVAKRLSESGIELNGRREVRDGLVAGAFICRNQSQIVVDDGGVFWRVRRSQTQRL